MVQVNDRTETRPKDLQQEVKGKGMVGRFKAGDTDSDQGFS
jgi:hypothetical protein